MIQFDSYDVLGRLTICAFNRSNDSNTGIVSDTDDDEDIQEVVGEGAVGSGDVPDSDVDEHVDEHVDGVGNGTGGGETAESRAMKESAPTESVVPGRRDTNRRGIRPVRYNSSN